MGIIEKQVQEHEKEKHIDTLEFIKTLLWYMDSTEKVRREWIEAQSNINAAYKARMKEILEEKSDLNDDIDKAIEAFKKEADKCQETITLM